MPIHTPKLTLTLHWRNPAGEQSTTAICDDRPPAELIPLLLDGCGLTLDATHYHLRLDAAQGRRLADDVTISACGVRSGSHLWLSAEQPVTRMRCLLALPEGGELLVPPQGLVIQRAWLLAQLALLDPRTHAKELAQCAQGTSRYRWVSRQRHCLIAPAATGWSLASPQADRITLLNGARLGPERPMPLRHDDRLTLGEEGPTLSVSLLGA